jgi:hypothetical protein
MRNDFLVVVLLAIFAPTEESRDAERIEEAADVD